MVLLKLLLCWTTHIYVWRIWYHLVLNVRMSLESLISLCFYFYFELSMITNDFMDYFLFYIIFFSWCLIFRMVLNLILISYGFLKVSLRSLYCCLNTQILSDSCDKNVLHMLIGNFCWIANLDGKCKTCDILTKCSTINNNTTTK